MVSTLTAIRRPKLSVPLRTLLTRPEVKETDRILDFGCGLGDDVRTLRRMGYDCDGYDPGLRTEKYFQHYPWGEYYDLVTMIYVLNTLRRDARRVPLEMAWNKVKPGGRLFVATRTARDVEYEAYGGPWFNSRDGGLPLWTADDDGWLTSKGTFQRGFVPADLELMGWHIFGEYLHSVYTIPAKGFTGVIYLKKA